MKKIIILMIMLLLLCGCAQKKNEEFVSYETFVKDEIDKNSDEDLDFDGLTNKEETKYKTDPLSSDTDLDGLDDYCEIFTSKTDPCNADTDGDGIDDYNEIQLNLNPKKKDKNIVREFVYEGNETKAVVNGKGNIATTLLTVEDNNLLTEKDGLINKLYSFYSEGEIESAVLTFSYTDETLDENKIKEEDLTVFRINTQDISYAPVDSFIDKENNNITIETDTNGLFAIGSKQKDLSNNSINISFLIDNSWSMYDDSQYLEYTGTEWNGFSPLEASDVKGQRFSVTSELINRLGSETFNIGVSEFRGDAKTITSIGEDKNVSTKSLENMMGSFTTWFEGTNIGSAINHGIDELSSIYGDKYIVVLTDGRDSALSFYKTKITNKLKDKNIKLCSVTFGEGNDNKILSELSQASGCGMFSANDANGLIELFTKIEDNIKKGLADLDEDGINDYRILADNGFVVNYNGFSFNNPTTVQSPSGTCYGMASFAEMVFTDSMVLKGSQKTNGIGTANEYDLTNTYFAKNNNLYAYELSEAFTAALDDTIKQVVDGDTLVLPEPFKTSVEISDSIIKTKLETTLTPEEQIEKHGENYKYWYKYQIDLNKTKNDTTISDDGELFNALYRHFIMQRNREYVVNDYNIVQILDKVLKTEVIPDVKKYKSKQFMYLLENRIKNGEAVIICIRWDKGGHAVNAISLAQDLNDPFLYKLGVYDSNSPGEKIYIDVKCSVSSCKVASNNEYGWENGKVEMLVSLEDEMADLE